jgi:hypothetical protein
MSYVKCEKGKGKGERVTAMSFRCLESILIFIQASHRHPDIGNSKQDLPCNDNGAI